jgi:hypothetical protein
MLAELAYRAARFGELTVLIGVRGPATATTTRAHAPPRGQRVAAGVASPTTTCASVRRESAFAYLRPGSPSRGVAMVWPGGSKMSPGV